MPTNNEIAAFEDFKFNIGDIVRFITERVASRVTAEEARDQDAMVKITPVIGMVTSRSLWQDEAGISRVYHVKGVEFSGNFKEFEIERVSR